MKDFDWERELVAARAEWAEAQAEADELRDYATFCQVMLHAQQADNSGGHDG